MNPSSSPIDASSGAIPKLEARQEVGYSSGFFLTQQSSNFAVEFGAENTSHVEHTLTINFEGSHNFRFVRKRTDIESKGQRIFTVVVQPKSAKRFVTAAVVNTIEPYRLVYNVDHTWRMAEMPLSLAHDEISAVEELASGITNSDYLVLKCVREGIQFVDLAFPPDARSLKNPSLILQWRRPEDRAERTDMPAVVNEGFQPWSVHCGKEKFTSHFISVLCALCRAGSLDRIIPQHMCELPQGVVRSRICHNGWWEWVITDTLFPCLPGTGDPAFSHCDRHAVWAPAIEKCYAKLHDGYNSLKCVSTGDILTSFTGVHCLHLRFKHHTFDDNQSWDTLRRWLAANATAVANTPYEKCNSWEYSMPGDEIKRQNDEVGVACETRGLLRGHSYTILDAVEFTPLGKRAGVENGESQPLTQRLVKLRNFRWASSEWDGDWSIKQTTHWTSDTVSALQYDSLWKENAFWIPWTDLKRLFVGVVICPYREMSNEYRVRGSFQNGLATSCIQLTVPSDGEFTISLTLARESNDHPVAALYVLQPSKDGYAILDFSGFQKAKTIGSVVVLTKAVRPYLIVPTLIAGEGNPFQFPYVLAVQSPLVLPTRVKVTMSAREVVQKCELMVGAKFGKDVIIINRDCTVTMFCSGPACIITASNSGDMEWTASLDFRKSSQAWTSPIGVMEFERVIPPQSIRCMCTLVNSEYDWTLAKNPKDGLVMIVAKTEMNRMCISEETWGKIGEPMFFNQSSMISQYPEVQFNRETVSGSPDETTILRNLRTPTDRLLEEERKAKVKAIGAKAESESSTEGSKCRPTYEENFARDLEKELQLEYEKLTGGKARFSVPILPRIQSPPLVK